MDLNVILDEEQKKEICENIIAAILSKINIPQEGSIDRKLNKLEASELLGVTQVTIDEWRKLGILQYQKLGSRVYFKYSDLVNAGTKNRRLALK
jgi:hypothetical protein